MEYVSHTYQRFPVAVRFGHGAAAEDFERNSYIDFGSGIETNSLGFCSEGWADAVTEQLYSSWAGGAGSDESA